MILLENYYFMLIQNFLSLEEQIIEKDVNEMYAVMFDEHHRRSQLFLYDFKLFDLLFISQVINSFKLSIQHSFLVKLRDVYFVNYDKRMIELRSRDMK